MITLDMLKRGYEAGIIKLIDSPHGDGVVCSIGNDYFYFSGLTAAESTADDFCRCVPAEDFLKDIYEVLEHDFRHESGELYQDYLYYEAYLTKHLSELPVEALQDSEVMRGSPVQLSHSDGTWLAESMVASAVRYMEHACEMVSKINEGTYERGQAPLRFDCVTSPELAGDMKDLVDVFGKLVKAVGMDAKTLVAQTVQGNPSLAGVIYRLVDKDNYKADIVGKLEDMGIDVESLTDAQINKMAERFKKTLDNNDGYRESYWLSAEAAINEVMKEKNLQEEAGWKTTDEMVDKALPTIRGIGEWEGSGLFGLRDFVVDGERMELVVEICRFEDKEANREYYGVYYWVGYYGDDSLFADWAYTSSLDVDELKNLISDLEGKDFTEDIRKCMGKGSVEAVINDAQERCAVSAGCETIAQERVKE